MENSNGNALGGPEALDQDLAAQLGTIFSLLHQHTGHDFGRYKPGTMLRRIRRRIQTLHAASVAHYVALLQREPPEAQTLLKELLIGVTHFFRDGEAFEVLAQRVLPAIVEGRPAEMCIRVWVPGCASGEEVYSLAILLREHLQRAKEQRSVQLFATDLDAALLAEARRGRYDAGIAEHVSPARLARFFTREGAEYQVANELREMCVFSQHSLTRDSAFAQLDLISCRNVFIYLAADLQKRLIPFFHRALRSGGFLFLGPSDGVAALPDLFEAVERRYRIFRRIETVTPGPVELDAQAALRASQPLPAVGAKEITSPELPAVEDLESELRMTRAELHSAIERLESANEELKSANEELISTNEELISTNEELISTNEKLISTNEEMQRRTAELDATLSSMANGVVIFGPDGQKRFGNQAAQDILEYTPSEQALTDIGDRVRAMAFSNEDGSPVALDDTPVARALRGEVSKNVIMFVHRPGRDIWVSVNAAPIRGPNGKLLGAVSSIIDITALRQAERQVKDQGELLENTLKEVRLANQRLLEEDQRKNEFLAMLSHELRNPLAPIRNSLYVLDRAEGGSDQAKRAQATIDRQTAHLTRLVDDLLDVTRISRGKIQIRRQATNLCDLVRRTVDDHQSVFASDGVGLEIALPDAALWVDGDATRLTQVLGNLLHNAAKFSDRGGHASVSVAREQNAAVIRVRDTGIGVSQELLGRIFEPFIQAETTLDRARGGLGLGLALVKGLVELHGGSVRVKSDGLGQGAEFTISLPLLGLAASSESAPSTSRAPSPRRVLVIEDNLDAAESLREVLEFGGHAVEIANSGKDGIARSLTFRPDMILCDIGLPGMDGYEVARRLRAEKTSASAYLVALTGYALPEDLAKAKEAGFDEHIAKPASLERIEQLLANAPR